MSRSDSPIHWFGSTYDDVRELPADARVQLGYQLGRVQQGLEPDDWKPMPTVGSGCREIRMRTADGQHRSIYVIGGTPAGVYVLAVFTKKAQKTPDSVIKVARQRYRAAESHMKGHMP